ncbi:nSTAND1 domain-containing NTPase [Streptomyces sp. C10-9-1]|uniref:nSTAND1 domain-containing NTPase n=1 Tax=Streptomyces sp. C10-9-1 TaxID=1859285 RepID=UPI003F4A7BBD
MNSETMPATWMTGSHSNPYVGPRAFQLGEHLPNREREASELANLVVAERGVLLHSPSGAGKTSLIQSAVMGILAENGFRPLGPARVDKLPPPGLQVHNRYVYSLALYLLGQQSTDPHSFASCTLRQVLNRVMAEANPPFGEQQEPVLLIDQFEEALTLDPTDWEQKTEFFEELGSELSNFANAWESDAPDQAAEPQASDEPPERTRPHRLWLLLAMREDYMGGLEPYRKLLPGQLRARYRLDFLTHQEARLAIQRPAEDRGVRFSDAGAQALIERLATTKVSSPDHPSEWQPTPYVEPVQLQVVCHRLWREAKEASHDGFDAINIDDVEAADIDDALSRFYGDCVAEAASTTGVPEQVIRDWFENHLITTQGFRSQTVTRPAPGEEGVQLLKVLEDTHLIRADTRAQNTWYELEHDRLITAVRKSNDVWRWTHLLPWQVTAYDWQRSGRPKALLAQARELPRPAAGKDEDLTATEREFRAASMEEAHRGRLIWAFRSAVTMLAVVCLIQTAVIVVLIFLLV